MLKLSVVNSSASGLYELLISGCAASHVTPHSCWVYMLHAISSSYQEHCSTGTVVPYNLQGEATLAVSVAMSAAVRMPLALRQNKEEVLREVCIL